MNEMQKIPQNIFHLLLLKASLCNPYQ